MARRSDLKAAIVNFVGQAIVGSALGWASGEMYVSLSLPCLIVSYVVNI